jgi:hypothetical protein
MYLLGTYLNLNTIILLVIIFYFKGIKPIVQGNKMIDVSYFTNIYLAHKRNILKNPYLSLSHRDKELLPEVVDAINLLHAFPFDFLLFMSKYYSPMRIFPKPSHMLAKKALEKFKYHQTLKNRYLYDDASIEGDVFLIHETRETVSYKKDIMCPVDKDPRIKYVMFLIKEGKGKPEDKKDITYALIKLRFLDKPIPEELQNLKEKIDETSNM